MAIDKASIFAERFKTNPTILQQAVLGQGQVPNLDAFTALRALQLIKEEAAMRASMAGQNAPPKGAPSLAQEAVQSAGLGAMPVPEQGFAPGGIVAFSGDDDEDQTNQVVKNESGVTAEEYEKLGVGDLRKRLIGQLIDSSKRLSGMEFKEMTPDQQKAFITNYMSQVESAGGPSPYPKALEALAARRGRIGAGDNYERAGAFFEAAAAAQQPGGALRGIASAGASLGKGLGAIKKAQRAEELAIDRMQFDLMDAQRKERQGNMRGALSALESARKNQADAANARMRTEAAIGTNIGRALTATKPPTPPRPGSGPKLPEQLAAAEIAFGENPTPENKTRVEALRRAVAQTRTSDIGPSRVQVEEGKLDPKLVENFNKWKMVSGRSIYNQMTKQIKETNPNLSADQVEAEVMNRWKNTYGLESAAKPNAPAPKPAASAGGNFPVTAGGVTYFFPTKEAADQFRAAAGVK